MEGDVDVSICNASHVVFAERHGMCIFYVTLHLEILLSRQRLNQRRTMARTTEEEEEKVCKLPLIVS
jgi:hypothetical protein